jgi:uncharacterized protein (DUF58 family)
VKKLPGLPPVPARFPPPFRAALHEVLARGPRLAGGAVAPVRARRAALSQSGTFVGHRPYAPGDDLRRIDWAAYARSGVLYTKQLEEDERRTATLLLDLSARLLVGSPPRRLAMLRLAAIVGGLALRHLDGLSVVAPGAGQRSLATFEGTADLERLLQHLDELPIVTSTPQQAVELLLQRGVGGIVHWVADFADPGACELVLAAVRRRGGRVLGWLPALPEDTAAQARGYLRVADPATGEQFVVAVDAALAAALQRELDVLRRRQDRLFAQFGCGLLRWPVPAADDFRVRTYQELAVWCSR